jgi:lipoyl synthase
VTGVARDGLADEGVWLYAETVRKIHELNPGTGVELLIPDFSGKPEHIEAICHSKPEVFAHNVETVPRIFKRFGPRSGMTGPWTSSPRAATWAWSPNPT